MVCWLQLTSGMTRLALLAASIALFAASSARASRTGQVDVSASVVYSAVLRPVEVVSVRQIASAGRTRMVASVRPGAGPVLIEQRGGAPVQLLRTKDAGSVSVELADGLGAELVVTVFSDGAPAWHGR
jgi:hypothetical protein